MKIQKHFEKLLSSESKYFHPCNLGKKIYGNFSAIKLKSFLSSARSCRGAVECFSKKIFVNIATKLFNFDNDDFTEYIFKLILLIRPWWPSGLMRHSLLNGSGFFYVMASGGGLYSFNFYITVHSP